MNRCKTCKWWQWRRSEQVQFPCGNLGSDMLHGMIDAEQDTGVLTGPEFGCVNYEETQEQLPQEHPGYGTQQKIMSRRYPKEVKSDSILGFNIICSCPEGATDPNCLLHG